MRYLINPSTDPYYNLAFDEYCLENIVSDEPYFYLWRNRPSVIIGLSQNAYGEVNLEYLRKHGISLARRVTGGGAVYHDLQNLNYTIVGAHPTPQIMAEALRRLGVDAQMTGRNDIYVDGRKVSGYARRVTKKQEIIHGTLMYDVDLDTLTHVLDTPTSKLQSKGIASVKARVSNLKEYLPQFSSLDEVQEKLQEILSDGDSQMPFTKEQDAEVKALAESKFATWDFIFGHSLEAGFIQKAKLACGTVEASINIKHGIITGIDFTGDFLFDTPASELSSRLVGARFEKSEVRKILTENEELHCFRNTDTEEVLRLIFGETLER